jgi:hypothetical protein
MAVERRKYTKEYKESAAAMTERDDKTVGQVAGELGIDAGLRRDGGRRRAVFMYIEAYYNRVRMRSALTIRPPMCLTQTNPLNAVHLTV